MAKLNIAPTKSNQLNIREDLEMATEGFELLDQKREILVMELMKLLERVRKVQEKLDDAQNLAAETLRKAVTKNGHNRMRNVAAGIHYDHQVKSSTRITAGVKISHLSTDLGKLSSQFSFAGTDSLIDQTMKDFLELLKVIGELAAVETAVWLLARELKRTQRRVNALEQIFIPDFKETLHYITETLESKELEAFSIMKMVKKQIREKNDS